MTFSQSDVQSTATVLARWVSDVERVANDEVAELPEHLASVPVRDSLDHMTSILFDHSSVVSVLAAIGMRNGMGEPRDWIA